MDMESPPSRWEVSYTLALRRECSIVGLGFLFLRLLARQLVLFDEEGEVVDARCLKGEEQVVQGDEIYFACHMSVEGKRFYPVIHREDLLSMVEHNFKELVVVSIVMADLWDFSGEHAIGDDFPYESGVRWVGKGLGPWAYFGAYWARGGGHRDNDYLNNSHSLFSPTLKLKTPTLVLVKSEREREIRS
jgi:hypothetical protein